MDCRANLELVRTTNSTGGPDKMYHKYHATIIKSLLKTMEALCTDEVDIKRFWRSIGQLIIKYDGSHGRIFFMTKSSNGHPAGEYHRAVSGAQ
jgi:hypothetical protein